MAANTFNILPKPLVSQCVSHCHNNLNINFMVARRLQGAVSYKAANPSEHLTSCSLPVFPALGNDDPILCFLFIQQVNECTIFCLSSLCILFLEFHCKAVNPLKTITCYLCTVASYDI